MRVLRVGRSVDLPSCWQKFLDHSEGRSKRQTDAEFSEVARGV